jgi:hypothetical protein
MSCSKRPHVEPSPPPPPLLCMIFVASSSIAPIHTTCSGTSWNLRAKPGVVSIGNVTFNSYLLPLAKLWNQETGDHFIRLRVVKAGAFLL